MKIVLIAWFLDLRLPDMSGFDVLERIGNSPTLSDLPVVVFTGKDLSSEEERAIAHAGPAAWS